MKKNPILIVLAVAVVALATLLLRENEKRVRAESKLETLSEKATSVINEKGEAIADLSTQVGEMQAHLQQTTDECTSAVTERDMAVSKLTEDARVAQAEHESQVTSLETQMKESADKSDAALKKKNTELSGIGEELRKTTERLATALKDKEKAESESYDASTQLAAAQRQIAKLNEDNRHLEALAKICEGTAAPDTADGPAKTT